MNKLKPNKTDGHYPSSLAETENPRHFVISKNANNQSSDPLIPDHNSGQEHGQILFPILREFALTPVDDETTAHYASIYRQLKRKGRPIPTNVLWIAADYMQQGSRLLTADKRFTEIDGLLTGQVPFKFLP